MTSHNILVIEDSKDMKWLFEGFFNLLPAHYFEMYIYNGRDALKFLKCHRVSIILIDFPVLGAWEFLEYIQAHPTLRFVPLVVMSGAKKHFIDEFPKPFEYFEHCKKPFRPVELKQAVRSAINKAKLHYLQEKSHILADIS
ncbi:hypothetical protein GTQ43_25665 [Nostoc sp. KVJ3]|uniref:response regulator n=1 Tax=Nostoc sp. KVJ3 TaxID=457945 RepID=UPI002238B894|nr:hypothetical protein [Nostoc sp. KVJ3]MCW5317079.1 hypothetical protein [Nostoc sp. KVJ3]